MAKRLQLRRGTADQHSTFTGAIGELTYDTTNKQIRIHDGSTVGGNLVGPGVQFVQGANGVAAVTTSGSYYAAQWKGTNSNITSLYDGLTIAFRVQVAGNGTYGTLLQINSLDAKPVVVNVNTMVGTRYGVGCTVLLVYNSTQTATAYVDNTSTSFTGCWQIAEYDSTNINQLRMSNGSYLTNAALYRYMLLFKVNEDKLQPANTTSNSTATTKTLMTTEFDPHGEIFYYSSTTTVSSGSQITANTLYIRTNLDLRYSFNTGTTLTAHKSVYLKCSPTTNGKVTFASGNPIVQTLPTTEDGFVYIYLGQASSTSNLDLHVNHPIYHYYKNALRRWVSPVLATGIPMTGDRGSLAGYETIGSATTINATCADCSEVSSNITVSNGTSGTAWTKLVRVTAAVTVSLGTNWKWAGNEAPTITAGGICFFCWCGSAGIANFMPNS